MERILVIEDEIEIQELLHDFLLNAGYEVAVVGDGVAGIAAFHAQQYDLILLDIMLPKIDGFGVCEVIRQESNIPIVMLTALSSEEHQIKGLDLLVDDYITKPFSMPILLRKIAAVLRRTGAKTQINELIYREIVLNQDSYQVFVAKEEIILTAKEYEVLKELLHNQGKVLTRDYFLDKIWGYDFYGDDRVVDTHIKNIRRKLGVDYIETIRGVGYRIAKLV